MMKRCLFVTMMIAALVGITVSCATKGAAPAAGGSDLQKVESSLIDYVGYDAASETLTVVFTTTGETYVYQKVPEKTYKSLMSAKSKGQYFTKNIKNKYDFIKK